MSAPVKADSRVRPLGVVSLRRGGSEADTEDTDSARLYRRFSFCCSRRFLACGFRRWLIFARDLHCPIRAMSTTSCTGDADARRVVEQEIVSMSRRGNPLIERFFETVITISDVFRSPPRSRRSDPRTERSEHCVVERIFRGHCLGLFQRNPVKSCIHGDMSFAVLQAKVRNHVGG
jgi:hypothetical protein